MTKNIQIYIKTLKSGKTKFNIANAKGTDGNWYQVKFNKETGIELNNYRQGYYNVIFDNEHANISTKPYVSKSGVEGIDRTLWIKDPDVTIDVAVKDEDLPF